MPIAAILAADWGKEKKKRAVYVAEAASRTVRRLTHSAGWTLTSLVERARTWQHVGAVVIAIDAPLGVPGGYLRRARRALGLPANSSFLDLLDAVSDDYFAPVKRPERWHHLHPFFSVLPGRGGVGKFMAKARSRIAREVDRRTSAKSPFITSGIPGTVGSGAIALWQQLKTLRNEAPRAHGLKVWPFDGPLVSLARSGQIILAETYPRACYSIALKDCAALDRPLMPLAKTKQAARSAAIQALLRVRKRWARPIRIDGLRKAAEGEDDFDACFTAVALLRALLDGTLMQPTPFDDPVAEGGILGLSAVNVKLDPIFQPKSKGDATASARVSRRASGRRNPTSRPRIFRCPIAGCTKVFRGSRGGWDAHVGSRTRHPAWLQAIKDPVARRRAFEKQFPEFFGE